MNVLVLGGGGREHSICLKLKSSKKIKNLWCIPGNIGTRKIAKFEDLNLNQKEKVLNFCKKKKINLVIPGSEIYLADGISDSLSLEGIQVFGPSKQASMLESSKIFTKKICNLAGINTAKWQIFNSYLEALKKIKSISFPCVIKLDSLASGKGVIVAESLKEAELFLKKVKSGQIGNKKSKVIIEDKITGEEASFFFIVDGKSAKFLGSAKDYKRIGENNTGANTGGMGCISPSRFENKKVITKVLNEFILPTINIMHNLGYPYKGILYAGLMFTKKNIYLIEYNVRFGDPECQAILPRLNSDLLNLLLATINNRLNQYKVKLEKNKSVCIVLASKGYPGKFKSGYEISISKNITSKSTYLFHAGTKLNKNRKIITNGGRVLNLVVKNKNLKNAVDLAYETISNIKCENLIYRKDIGN